METPAINDGTDCLGDKTETAACNTDPCRKNINTQALQKNTTAYVKFQV